MRCCSRKFSIRGASIRNDHSDVIPYSWNQSVHVHCCDQGSDNAEQDGETRYVNTAEGAIESICW